MRRLFRGVRWRFPWIGEANIAIVWRRQCVPTGIRNADATDAKSRPRSYGSC